jgi:hypothetical protein
MPVDISRFAEKVAPKSTYPANIAYEAARRQDPAKADRYLRRFREGAATESRSIHLPEIQADLAEETGLDRARFLADLAGPVKEAFAEDQRLCREHGVQGFPTFLVRGGGRERILRGYARFPAFAALFDSLADKPLERFRSAINEASVLGFVRKYGSAATREVSEVFEVTDSDEEALLRPYDRSSHLHASVPRGRRTQVSPQAHSWAYWD